MRLFDDFYVYPWVSYQENNCNTIFVDGPIPTLIDPGHAHLFNHVADGMAQDGKTVERIKLIICTHGHPDHIEALDRFDNGVLKAISREDYRYLGEEGKELFLMTGCQMPKKPFKLFLTEGRVKLGGKTFRIIPTPGHSPGSICLYWEEKKLLVSGDTVFYMGMGRTDLPGGDMEMLGRSIEQISKLTIEYLVPGHGELLKGEETVNRNFELILGEFF
ncbi:MAG: putative metallo-hydrolase [Syntrophorhabdus sp. PtaU1.Bin153]|nr:MAG: putative metallo-hydrolase [Syntrophorhabdus sp. PtaU1.Bin153]